MKISDNSFAIITMCTSLASKGDGSSINPLTTKQWSKLYNILVENKLAPADLFTLSREDMKYKLLLHEKVIDRIDKLRELSGKLGYEISEIRSKGIEIITIADEDYPEKYKIKLGSDSPPALFYSGKLALFNNKGIAIVGSRDIDEDALKFTKQLAECCTNSSLNIVSGGARGVDSVAESIAIKNEGTTVIIMANNMDRKIRDRDVRRAIMNNSSLIISAHRPDMPFQAYAAMERNKYIYAAADYSVVVSSAYNKGGTWAGATENHKKNFTPLFVRQEEGMPKGNIKLLEISNVFPITIGDLKPDSVVDTLENAIKTGKTSNIEQKQKTLFEL